MELGLLGLLDNCSGGLGRFKKGVDNFGAVG